MILAITLIVISAIILVTAYEVYKNISSGDGLDLSATNSFYKLPRKKPDNKRLRAPDSDAIANDNSCTYSFWVRPELSAFGTSGKWLVFYRGTKGAGDSHSEASKDLTVEVEKHGGLHVNVSGTDVIIPEVIELRRWTHVGICLDTLDRFIEIYINGELLKTVNSSSITIGEGELYINPENRKGWIQNLKFFNDVTSSKQMSALYWGQSTFVNLTNRFVINSSSDEGSVLGNVQDKCGELESDKSNTERIRQMYEDGITESDIATALTAAKRCKVDYGKTEDAGGNSVEPEFVCFSRLPKCIRANSTDMYGECKADTTTSS